MRKIGLMGGSFNPVHEGHLNLARAALRSGRVNRVLFLPTGNPPHKHAGLADKMDRLAMVELAVAGETGMDVCREEIEREGVIYTVDTLARLNGRLPGCRLVYLIGADTLGLLGTWRHPEEVIRLCDLLVLMRPGQDEAQARIHAQEWMARGARIDFLTAAQMEISSTEIRRRVSHGETIAGMVPPPVEKYILAHGLYQMGIKDGLDETRKDGI